MKLPSQVRARSKYQEPYSFIHNPEASAPFFEILISDHNMLKKLPVCPLSLSPLWDASADLEKYVACWVSPRRSNMIEAMLFLPLSS